MVINSERIKYERNHKCSCVNCKYYGLRRCKLGIVLFIDGICINKSELKLSNHDTFEAKGEILTKKELTLIENVIGGGVSV